MFAIKVKSTPHFSVGAPDMNFKYIANHLAAVGKLYPDFKDWLYMTFRPGYLDGTRSMLICDHESQISGLALLKNDLSEKKICTFYVSPEFRGQGIGTELMKRSVQALGEREICITVPEERSLELYPTLNSSGFKVTAAVDGMYRSGKIENIYTL